MDLRFLTNILEPLRTIYVIASWEQTPILSGFEPFFEQGSLCSLHHKQMVLIYTRGCVHKHYMSLACMRQPSCWSSLQLPMLPPLHLVCRALLDREDASHKRKNMGGYVGAAETFSISRNMPFELALQSLAFVVGRGFNGLWCSILQINRNDIVHINTYIIHLYITHLHTSI